MQEAAETFDALTTYAVELVAKAEAGTAACAVVLERQRVVARERDFGGRSGVWDYASERQARSCEFIE